MAVLNTRQCDGCGKLAEDGNVQGWMVVQLLAPLPVEAGEDEPALNEVGGDYHSPSCLRNKLDKVAPKREVKKK